MLAEIAKSPLPPSGATPTHLLTDDDGNNLLSYGTTVPSGVAGYALSALFIKTDATAGKGWYTNTGSTSSCTFTRSGQLADTAGAGLVGLLDSGGFTATTTVEAALAELYQHLFSVSGGFVDIPLTAWREVSSDNDVSNIAGAGGQLASDTTPILKGNANGGLEISWATGDVDAIGVQIGVPADLDDAADLLLDLFVKAGTTNAFAATIASNFDGGNAVSDSAAGSASASLHTATVTIAASDVPASAKTITLRLTPGTHAADVFSLHGARLRYRRKLLVA